MDATTKWTDLAARRKAYETEAEKAGKAFKVKVFGGDDVGIEPDRGDYVATICTDTPDDDGEVVQPRLMDLSRFQKVMAVHLDHDIQSLPIGRAKWIKASDHAIVSKYFISQATPETRAIDFMLKEGVLHMHSISFIGDKAVTPSASDIAANPSWKGNKVYKGNPLMVEFSVVGQPANPDCDMLAIGKRFGLAKATIDMFTGKAANTVKAAAEVIAAINEKAGNELAIATAAITAPARTEADLWKLIGKRLEQVINDVDYDRVRKQAMTTLGKSLN